MNNWLIGFSEHQKTDEETVRDAVSGLTVPELNSLLWDLDPSLRPSQVEDLHEKLANATRTGRELAHERNDLQKIAFIPALLAGAGRAAGALGGAKSIIGGVAKDMAIGSVANKALGALKPSAPAAAAAGEVAGGFKYAFAGGLMQQAAGYAVRNPGTALTAAGAVGGALLAPRDKQTGQKQYLRGAVMGGGLAAGANALSNGGIANKMRSSVMNRQSPLLGQGTRSYLMDSAAAGKGKSPISSSLRSKQTQYASNPAPAVTPSASSTPAPTSATAASPPAVAPTLNQGQQAAHDATRAGLKVPADMLHPETPMTMGGVNASAGMAGGSFAQRPGFLSRVFGKDTPGVVKQAFANMSPAQQILFVAQAEALVKRANQQTLTYDPATKTFTRQHLTPSSGSAAVAQTGAAPIPAGHAELVRNSGTAMAPYGSKEYLQSRLQGVGVNTNRFSTPPQPTPAVLPQGTGRSARWQANSSGAGAGVASPSSMLGTAPNKARSMAAGAAGKVPGLPKLPTTAGRALSIR